MLKRAAATGELAVLSGMMPCAAVFAQINLRARILVIPGVGAGSSTDADRPNVGEMCLGSMRATLEESELVGVDLTLLGVYNQNTCNFLFRGFFKS